MEQVAAVRGEDPLRAPDEVVELRDGVVVVVVVDAAEANEDRVRRPQLGQELAAPRAQALVDGRQQPRPCDVLGQRLLLARARASATAPRPAARRRRRSPPLSGSTRSSWISTRSPRDSSADRSSRTSPLAARCSAVASASISRPARTSISWTSGSPTRNRRAAPVATAAFIASRTREPAGCRDLALPGHRLLHREGAGGGARAIVAIDPAGDRVAAEVDDVPAEPLELGNEGVKDPVQMGSKLLRAALRPEFVGQRLGQRREPGDVREKRGAANAVGKRLAAASARRRSPGMPRPLRRGWGSGGALPGPGAPARGPRRGAQATKAERAGGPARQGWGRTEGEARARRPAPGGPRAGGYGGVSGPGAAPGRPPGPPPGACPRVGATRRAGRRRPANRARIDRGPPVSARCSAAASRSVRSPQARRSAGSRGPRRRTCVPPQRRSPP